MLTKKNPASPGIIAVGPSMVIATGVCAELDGCARIAEMTRMAQTGIVNLIFYSSSIYPWRLR